MFDFTANRSFNTEEKNMSEVNGQFTQAVVSLYCVYCCKIIQQRMLVVDNFHVKIRYTYTHFYPYVFKSCIGFMLSN